MRRVLLPGLLLISTMLAIEGVWIPVKARLAQALLERSWHETRSGASQARPWPWADTWPIARLEVPRLGVRRIVLSGASGRSLAFAPGHLDGSAPPGADGNVILAGHRDTTFRFLAALALGDRMTLQGREGEPATYGIEWIEIMESDDPRAFFEEDRPTLTLVTCYPFDSLLPGGTLRFVVRARRIDESRAPRA